MLHFLLLSFVTVSSAVLLVIGILILKAWLEEARKDRIPTLLYHRFLPWEKVRNGEIKDDEPVYTSYDMRFEEQMRYLYENGYHTISIAEYVEHVKNGGILPIKPVIITFDDGFESNYLYAFPQLRKYQQTATIFMTADKKSENFRKYDYVDKPLSNDQLIEMQTAGISIQSHSMTHVYLSELSEEAVRWELSESRKALETLLRSPIEFLAIPSGAYNGRIKRIAKETGYKAVYCMKKGSNNDGSDLFALRRMVIRRDFTIEDFKRSLEPFGAFQDRITGYAQGVLLKVLGPSHLWKFRSGIYKTRLANRLIFRKRTPIGN
jgi:peptidoglycan/xylan/chitin deacetylase (PgdA/CDA1 family)